MESREVTHAQAQADERGNRCLSGDEESLPSMERQPPEAAYAPVDDLTTMHSLSILAALIGLSELRINKRTHKQDMKQGWSCLGGSWVSCSGRMEKGMIPTLYTFTDFIFEE